MRFRIVTNCGPAEPYIARCIDSIRAQSDGDFTAHVTCDPCGDATYARAVDAAAGDRRFDIVANTRRMYAMHNLVHAVARSGDDADDVIVILDGDDCFATSEALAIIRETYARHDCWMTYGSWIADPIDFDAEPHCRGQWPAFPDGTTDFRSGFWLGTAVRTFKRWLWERIDDGDLRDADGEYYRIVEDQACMIPMLEMATTRRAKHIADVLMRYNRANPHNVGRVALEEMRATAQRIRARRPYAAIHSEPISNIYSLRQERRSRGKFERIQ
jgi:hypothetical protein